MTTVPQRNKEVLIGKTQTLEYPCFLHRKVPMLRSRQKVSTMLVTNKSYSINHDMFVYSDDNKKKEDSTTKQIV